MAGPGTGDFSGPAGFYGDRLFVRPRIWLLAFEDEQANDPG